MEAGSNAFGLAALVLAASLLEARRKQDLAGADPLQEILANAVVYLQAFAADQPPEVEQEAQRILEMLAKCSREAIPVSQAAEGRPLPSGEQGKTSPR